MTASEVYSLLTLQEFKAWFAGYTEHIQHQPDEQQWARIKQKVLELDGYATPTLIDRYSHVWPVVSNMSDNGH